MRSEEAYAILRVAGHEVAVAAAALCEILPRPPGLLPALADSSLVPGRLALHGAAMPAIALRALLGLAGEEPASGVIIVLQIAEGRIGLAADGIAELRYIPNAAWRPAAAEAPGCDAVHLPAEGDRLVRRLGLASLPVGRSLAPLVACP